MRKKIEVAIQLETELSELTKPDIFEGVVDGISVSSNDDSSFIASNISYC